MRVVHRDRIKIIWDEFGRQRQPWASQVPYMLVPGNHEVLFNFAAYRHRYPMSVSPGALGANLYWATDYGRMRFVGLTAEGLLDTPVVTPDMLSWLRAEMATSRKRKIAGAIDWIVVSIHRPLYCSSWKKQCDEYAAQIRASLEDVLQQGLADIVFQGHAHNYEVVCVDRAGWFADARVQRTTPVYKGAVMAPRTAPTYIVNGISGCREGTMDNFPQPGPPWRAKGVASLPGNPAHEMFGYGLLSANATSLSFRIFSDDTGIFDQITIEPRIIS